LGLNYKIMFFNDVKWIRGGILAVTAVLLLSGCAETQLFFHAAKELQNQVKAASKQPQQGRYKVGNPYQISGIWYYPKVEYNYDETGVASWYGKQFHGKPTANGETFDMNLVSAAHRTLPLPSVVQVVNLKNGRSIQVRVNDRGPFAHSRILDLSRRAAQLLGFEREGTAPVRVQIVTDESRRLAGLTGATERGVTQIVDDHPVPSAAPRTAVVSSELPAPDAAKSRLQPTEKKNAVATIETVSLNTTPSTSTISVNGALVALTPVPDDPKMYIQAGAFVRFDNANRLKAILSPIGPVEITQIRVTGRPLFRVRLGPILTVKEADGMLASVVRAGYADSRLIID
jgi:rare lipoprotein A